jgi:Family of unknown function (DUF5681)
MNPKGNVSNLVPFKPGQSGNPGGRPAAARNRLQGDFLNALAEHFAENGKDAIVRLCKKNPVAYIKAVASLMPRQFESGGLLDDVPDEDVRTLIALVKAARAERAKSAS